MCDLMVVRVFIVLFVYLFMRIISIVQYMITAIVIAAVIPRNMKKFRSDSSSSILF